MLVLPPFPTPFPAFSLLFPGVIFQIYNMHPSPCLISACQRPKPRQIVLLHRSFYFIDNWSKMNICCWPSKLMSMRLRWENGLSQISKREGRVISGEEQKEDASPSGLCPWDWGCSDITVQTFVQTSKKKMWLVGEIILASYWNLRLLRAQVALPNLPHHRLQSRRAHPLVPSQ